jgi:hypothetical protein
MKGTLRVNRKQAFVQDAVRAAFREGAGDGISLHPFVLALQTLRREVGFMMPFATGEMKHLFLQSESCYNSAVEVLKEAESNILGDSDVTEEADSLLPLVEYHSNLLKIHRLIFTREVEGYGLIPVASPGLQKQVIRTYEALEQLDEVLSVITERSKVSAALPGANKRLGQRSISKVRSAKALFDAEDEALAVDYRVSPFITDGSKKGTISIDGTLWARFV